MLSFALSSASEGRRPPNKSMVTREVLPNGLTLVTETIPHVRSVAIGVWLRRGSRHETLAQSGISHFIEHMVFKGTKNRSAEDIASEVDSIGGHMDAFTAKEYASFHLKVLDEHLPLAVDILGDIVMNPLFDPIEMAKEKRVIFEEMGMVEDTPDDLVMELFAELFWPKHPLGRPILGTRKSVDRFQRKHLLEFFRRVYHPGNVVVAAAGHLKHARLLSLVNRHFGGLAAGGAESGSRAPRRAPGGIVTRTKKELEQVHLCLGTQAFPQGHDDRYGCYVLNTILGGSMSSRLFQNVRERRGLVYSISSGVTAYSDSGNLTIYAGSSLKNIDEVLKLTLDELRRLKVEPVPEPELRRAKDHLKGSLMLSLENTGSRMSHLARQEIYHGRHFGLDETLQGIAAVEASDVTRIASKLFRGDLTLSVLGNLGRYSPRPSQIRV
jgi:predicted Zn-dependent peptidase